MSSAYIDLLKQHSLNVPSYVQNLCLFCLASADAQEKVEVGKREGKTLGETYAILLSFTDPPGHWVSWELVITQRPVDI